MASYRDHQAQQKHQGCFCPYQQYECPEICRDVDTAVMLITSATEQEHCNAAVHFEYCPIYECAAQADVSDVWQ